MQSPRADLLERVEEIVDAFNRHDVEAILGYLDEDCEWLMAGGPEPWGRRLRGRAEIGRVLAERFARIPDMRWEPHANWVAGERAVSEWTVRGTPADGPPMEWRGCDLWRFRDGRVVRKDTYWKIRERRG